MSQKDWVEQQKREKEEKKESEKSEESAYAKQTLDVTRMRGMLEDESTAKRKEMLKTMQLENQALVSL